MVVLTDLSPSGSSTSIVFRCTAPAAFSNDAKEAPSRRAYRDMSLCQLEVLQLRPRKVFVVVVTQPSYAT